MQAAKAVKYVHLANWSRGCFRGSCFYRWGSANVCRLSFLHCTRYCLLYFRWNRSCVFRRALLVCLSGGFALLLEVVLYLGFCYRIALLDDLLDLLEVVSFESVFLRQLVLLYEVS